MDKFSVYEFLSFFLPGAFAVFIGVQFVPSSLVLFDPQSELVAGLMFTTVAISVGLIVHRISFSLIPKQWYRKLIMKPIDRIVAQNPEGLKKIYSQLDEQYNAERYNTGQLFDKAYHYLEFVDRIAPAKSFQSIYFFLRNLTLIIVFYSILLIIPLCLSYNTRLIYLLFSANIISLPILINVANFYRSKMTIRIFATYLIAMQFLKKEVKNQ